MDAARELAQLRERVRELVARGRHELLRGGVVADAVLQQPELQRDPDEALLRAVVQVALEPPPLRVAGRDDPLARGLQLDHPGLRLGVQVLVLERDRGRRGDGLHELRVVVERRVVDQRRDALAVAVDGRDRPVAARRGQRDLLSRGVGVGLVLRQPVRHDELRIAERPRQRRLQVAAAHRAQPEEQLREAAAREPRPQQAGEEGQRDRDQRARREPQQHLRARAGDQVVEQQRREQRQAKRPGEARQQRAAPRARRLPPAERDHGDGDDARADRAARAGSCRSRLRRRRPGTRAAGGPPPGRTASRRPGGSPAARRTTRRAAGRASTAGAPPSAA